MPLICLTALLSGVLNGMERFGAAAASQVALQRRLHRLHARRCWVWCRPPAMRWPGACRSRAWHSSRWWPGRCAGPGCRLAIPPPAPDAADAAAAAPDGARPAGRRGGAAQLAGGHLGSRRRWLAPGTVTVLYFAERLNQLPLGIIGTAVGTAILPSLRRASWRRARRRTRTATINRAIEFALMLTLPAALGFRGRGAADHRRAVRPWRLRRPARWRCRPRRWPRSPPGCRPSCW